MNADLEKELRAKTQWTRADIEQLTSLRPVVSVWEFAAGSHFDDGALVPLQGAPGLRMCSFQNSDLSHDNLRALAALPALVRLSLKDCRFRPDDFAAFCQAAARGGLPKLSELWLEDSSIGDDDLRELGQIASLRWLILSGTKISNAGLEFLRDLKKLETLWLERTPISDDGILRLAVLPHLSIVAVRETMCSPDIKERLFAAQVAQTKSKKPTNSAQAEVADARLREFLREREAWERAAWERAQAIEAKYRGERPQSNVYSEAEGKANEVFWREINEQKACLADRFCSQKLVRRGAGRAGSYGNPPSYEAKTGDWVAVETPSKNKTIFTGAGGIGQDSKRHYTVVWENGEWRLDEVQWWAGGWKRDLV